MALFKFVLCLNAAFFIGNPALGADHNNAGGATQPIPDGGHPTQKVARLLSNTEVVAQLKEKVASLQRACGLDESTLPKTGPDQAPGKASTQNLSKKVVNGLPSYVGALHELLKNLDTSCNGDAEFVNQLKFYLTQSQSLLKLDELEADCKSGKIGIGAAK